jgi:hypothetical protein
LSKLEGVTRVHPNGLNGKARVFLSDKKAFSEVKAKEALLNTEKLRLRKYDADKG